MKEEEIQNSIVAIQKEQKSIKSQLYTESKKPKVSCYSKEGKEKRRKKETFKEIHNMHFGPCLTESIN